MKKHQQIPREFNFLNVSHTIWGEKTVTAYFILQLTVSSFIYIKRFHSFFFDFVKNGKFVPRFFQVKDVKFSTNIDSPSVLIITISNHTTNKM